MDVLDDLFGELRSIAHAPASAEVWAELCALLELAHEAAPGRTAAEWVPYADRALMGWPDDLRVAPSSWLAPHDGAPPALLRVCRVMTLSHTFDEGHARALVHAHDHLTNIHTLRLVFEPTFPGDWGRAWGDEWRGDWEFVSPAHPTTPHAAAHLADTMRDTGAPWLPNLRVVELVGGWHLPFASRLPHVVDHPPFEEARREAAAPMRAVASWLATWTNIHTARLDGMKPALETLRLCAFDPLASWDDQLRHETWHDGTLWELYSMKALFEAGPRPTIQRLVVLWCEAIVDAADAQSDHGDLSLVFDHAWLDHYTSPGPGDGMGPGWRRQIRPETDAEALRTHDTVRALRSTLGQMFGIGEVCFEGPCALHRFPYLYTHDSEIEDDSGSIFFNEAEHAYYNGCWE